MNQKTLHGVRVRLTKDGKKLRITRTTKMASNTITSNGRTRIVKYEDDEGIVRAIKDFLETVP